MFKRPAPFKRPALFKGSALLKRMVIASCFLAFAATALTTSGGCSSKKVYVEHGYRR